MADEPTKETKPSKHRVVKNPETFRERAIKASEDDDKPSRLGSTRHAVGAVIKAIFRPFGTFFKKIGSLRAFRILRKPLRILGKILLPTYLRNSWKELRLVTWPTWEQSRQLTFAVLIFAVIFGATIALVDYGLDKVFRNILLK